MRLPLLIFCAILCMLCTTSSGQDSSSLVDKIIKFPTTFIEKLQHKANNLEEKLMHYSEKALAKLEKQEQKLKKNWQKKILSQRCRCSGM